MLALDAAISMALLFGTWFLFSPSFHVAIWLGVASAFLLPRHSVEKRRVVLVSAVVALLSVLASFETLSSMNTDPVLIGRVLNIAALAVLLVTAVLTLPNRDRTHEDIQA